MISYDKFRILEPESRYQRLINAPSRGEVPFIPCGFRGKSAQRDESDNHNRTKGFLRIRSEVS
eukprot:1319302-Amorphochlora_amoeboformis.AAC.1